MLGIFLLPNLLRKHLINQKKGLVGTILQQITCHFMYGADNERITDSCKEKKKEVWWSNLRYERWYFSSNLN